MGSYHSSFGYLTKEIKIDEYGNEEEIKFDSFNDYNLLITSFEPGDGFSDTFLSIDNISDDYYDGTKKFNYGSRYNSSAEIQITLIKSDKSDFSLKEFRNCAKWLTGAKIDSWLDMYTGGKYPVYSFLGKFTNLEHYKLDGRIIGVKATFSSISPWAWSRPINTTLSIDQVMSLTKIGDIKDPETGEKETEDGILIKAQKDINDKVEPFGVDDNGILYANSSDQKSTFKIDERGIIYFDTSVDQEINNESDDLYTYIYLDITYENSSSTFVTIDNVTLDEKTEIYNIKPNEEIKISSKQFILSVDGEGKSLGRTFGDDFNFVWPRMAPGVNKFIVEGNGSGAVRFTYRYPMKVGDCAMDLTVYSGDDGGCGNIASYDTIRWENITGTPTTLGGYGITDAYTKNEVYNKNETYSIDDVYSKDEVYSKGETYSKDQVYNKNETYSSDDVYTKDEVYRKDETYSADMVYTKDDVYNKNETYSADQVYRKDETYSSGMVYTKEEVYTKDETYPRAHLYTKDEVYAKYETYPQDQVYTTDDVYTKDETYSKDDVYTKDEVDSKIENIEVSGGSGGTSGSVSINEQELNDMLAGILG